jgi:hypothetical protein
MELNLSQLFVIYQPDKLVPAMAGVRSGKNTRFSQGAVRRTNDALSKGVLHGMHPVSRRWRLGRGDELAKEAGLIPRCALLAGRPGTCFQAARQLLRPCRNAGFWLFDAGVPNAVQAKMSTKR